MVFGELVDTVPLLGSQRRAYVFVGAGLIAVSFVLLAGAAGGWITVLPADRLYVVASLMAVTGSVIQDVVADAMSTEVVPLANPDGSPRTKADIDHDLGMVQVLGRLALAFGIFAVAGVSGWLASWVSYSTVFLCGLIVPVISISGALLVRLETSEQRPTDWRILGGGVVFGAFVVVMALSDIGFSQEIIFAVSMAVVIWMLDRVTHEVDHATRMHIVYAAIIIFAFRATPSVGEGYRWFTIDVLGFDEAFYGTLQQLGAVIAIVGTWLLSDLITRRPVPQVLLWLTLLGTVLAVPTLALVFQLQRRHGAAVRHRCARHRPVRRGRGVAARPARHDPAADADRHLCSGQPSRHLVRADGVADEPGADGGRARHQVSQPDLPRRSRQLRQPAGPGGDGLRRALGAAADGDRGVREARAVTPS